MWVWGAACPAITAVQGYYQWPLTKCWASTNPFGAIAGEPNAHGVRHTPTEAQCHQLPETDIGLCPRHHKEITG